MLGFNQKLKSLSLGIPTSSWSFHSSLVGGSVCFCVWGKQQVRGESHVIWIWMGGCLKVVAASLFRWIVALLMGRIGLLFQMTETPSDAAKADLGNVLAPGSHLQKGRGGPGRRPAPSEPSVWMFPSGTFLPASSPQTASSTWVYLAHTLELWLEKKKAHFTTCTWKVPTQERGCPIWDICPWFAVTWARAEKSWCTHPPQG